MSDNVISTASARGIDGRAPNALCPVPSPVQRAVRHAWRNGSTLTGERLLAEEVAVAFSDDGQGPCWTDRPIGAGGRGGGVVGCLRFPDIGCAPCRSKPTPLAGTTFRDNGTG
jgi:hypothetical protein